MVNSPVHASSISFLLVVEWYQTMIKLLPDLFLPDPYL